MSADPTVAAGISLVDAFSALSTRGAAGARDASHALADSILSLAPLDREADRDGGTRGSATPLVEAHLRVAHWIVERAGDERSVDATVSGVPQRHGPVSDPGDPLLSRLPLHLPFGGTIARETDAAPSTRRAPHDATPSILHLPRPLGSTDRPVLTAREAEVARLVVGGASNREIAGRMHLSVRTVEVHLGRVFQKLNVHSRTQLSLLVHQGGYVETRS